MNKEQLLKALEENNLVCLEGIPKNETFLDDEKVRFKLSSVYTVGVSPYSFFTNNEKFYNVVSSSKMAFTARLNLSHPKQTMCKYRIAIFELDRVLNSFKDLVMI